MSTVFAMLRISQFFLMRGCGMSIKTERQEQIIELLKTRGYMTVRELTELLHYSSATVNRDLNDLVSRQLVTRNYGGAKYVEQTVMPYSDRYNFLRMSKRHIARAAAALVSDGDVIFIDGSTTTQYMAEGLKGRKNLTVITHSHTLSEALHTMGHRVIELGGEIVEMPGITGGSLAVRNAALFQADKLFFSTVGLSEDGRMLTGIDRYDLLLSTMIRCSQKRCFLLDHDKFPFVTHPGQNLVSIGSLEGIDTVVSDCEFPEAFTSRFPRTEFRFVTPCKE